jgi:hypothetical protein
MQYQRVWDQYVEALKALRQQLNFSEGIQGQPSWVLTRAYKSAHVLLKPSFWESFGSDYLGSVMRSCY